jgi:hypothetical protein
MKIIQPADVIPSTGELISNSVDKIIIATIDFDIQKYPPLWDILKSQKEMGVKLFFYTGNSFIGSHISDLLQVKDPLIIRNLNFNLVINDQQALISTQHFGSPTNSKHEVSLLTETEQEYQEIFTYYVEYLHENASQPSSYYLLNTETLNESVLLNYLVPYKKYKDVNIIKKYHPLSTYIASLGYLHQGIKIGSWLYFNEEGILNRIENHEKGLPVQQKINLKEEINKKYMFYSFVNIIGGLYQVSIHGVNLSTSFEEMIGTRNRNVFFDKIQQYYKIKFPPCAIHNLAELIDLTLSQMEKKKGKAVWQKLIQKK